MTRERNKPEKSWLEKAEEELVNSEELIVERAYDVGRIRGKKETIEKAKKAFNKTCGWLSVYPWYNEVFEEFVKMIEE